MELKVKSIEGKETSKKITLPAHIFGIEPNEHLMYLDVKYILANRRQGTHKTKSRSEVSYSTRKIIKQKGSGGARHGSIKAGIFVGGGRVFGPQPRDYSFKINQKERKIARASALSAKLKNGLLDVIEKINLEKPSTKNFYQIVQKLGDGKKNVLFLLAERTPSVILSSRNIPGVTVLEASQLNTYDVLKAGKVLVTEDAIVQIEKMF